MADAPYSSDSDPEPQSSGNVPIPRRQTTRTQMAPVPPPDVRNLTVDPALLPKAGGRPRKEEKRVAASSAAALESDDDDQKQQAAEIAQAKIQAALGQAMLQAAAQRRAEMAAGQKKEKEPVRLVVKDEQEGNFYTDSEILYLMAFGAVTGVAFFMLGRKIGQWIFAEPTSKVALKGAAKHL